MDLNIASHQTGNYTVQIPVYEGPLDLLLHLIERAELDITAVALAMVTDQYLKYIRAMQEARAEEISAFLVIAAKLIQIKSEALLPRPPVARGRGGRPGGKPGPPVAHLQTVQANRQLDGSTRKRRFAHLPAPGPAAQNRRPSRFERYHHRRPAQGRREHLPERERKQALGTVISAPRVTIREKISYISEHLSKGEQASFKELIRSAKTRLEVVVTFLAMLELIKRYRVAARQETLFGDIEIQRDDWEQEEEFELEFE
jgi:segregation and condensation protein A